MKKYIANWLYRINIINKNTALCSIFVLMNLHVFSQVNLVRDGSFEDTTNTVNGFAATSLKYWRNLSPTNLCCYGTAYFNLYSPNGSFTLPDNQWFYQFPRGGGGF
jgi:hypothetical protein